MTPLDQAPTRRYIGRLTVESGPGKMRIVVPRIPKGWGLLWFLLILSVLPTLNPKFREALSPQNPGSRIVLSIYCGGIVLLGIWRTAARDVISIVPPTLGVRHAIFGLGWTRHYPPDQIDTLTSSRLNASVLRSWLSSVLFDEVQERCGELIRVVLFHNPWVNGTLFKRLLAFSYA
jgi:hypothetical protein